MQWPAVGSGLPLAFEIEWSEFCLFSFGTKVQHPDYTTQWRGCFCVQGLIFSLLVSWLISLMFGIPIFGIYFD